MTGARGCGGLDHLALVRDETEDLEPRGDGGEVPGIEGIEIPGIEEPIN